MLFERAERGTKELKREADMFAVQQYTKCCNNCGGEHAIERNKCRLLTNAATHATSGITLLNVVDLSLKIQVGG